MHFVPGYTTGVGQSFVELMEYLEDQAQPLKCSAVGVNELAAFGI